ncbi:MAG TPA: hypothetical protein VFG74_09575 [Miltoncostaeaceae bacterium]|nr:hypothetical protein [Miltoncostaeaceae bacterium]
MRVGTWNLEGRWSPAHRALLEGGRCDAWLLTEVPAGLDLGRGRLVASAGMGALGGRTWAAVWSAGEAVPVASPHPAAALAVFGDLLLCSCVLPWRGAGRHWPGDGDTAARTCAAIDAITPVLAAHDGPLVWGGDWNHALAGPETAGSLAGRAAIDAAAVRLGLRVATAGLPHRLGGRQRAIDHVAVPVAARVRLARRIPAARLSDHDAYVVDVGSSRPAHRSIER